MSLNVRLNIQNKEYTLLQLSFSLKREIDDFGRPGQIIKSGYIHMLVNSSERNTHLVERFTDIAETVSGKITYYNIISDQKVKEIEFFNGHFIFYEETYDATSNSTCTEKITILAQDIRIGKVRFATDWPL